MSQANTFLSSTWQKTSRQSANICRVSRVVSAGGCTPNPQILIIEPLYKIGGAGGITPGASFAASPGEIAQGVQGPRIAGIELERRPEIALRLGRPPEIQEHPSRLHVVVGPADV